MILLTVSCNVKQHLYSKKSLLTRQLWDFPLCLLACLRQHDCVAWFLMEKPELHLDCGEINYNCLTMPQLLWVHYNCHTCMSHDECPQDRLCRSFFIAIILIKYSFYETMCKLIMPAHLIFSPLLLLHLLLSHVSCSSAMTQRLGWISLEGNFFFKFLTAAWCRAFDDLSR